MRDVTPGRQPGRSACSFQGEVYLGVMRLFAGCPDAYVISTGLWRGSLRHPVASIENIGTEAYAKLALLHARKHSAQPKAWWSRRWAGGCRWWV
jgi:hypothetical protein